MAKASYRTLKKSTRSAKFFTLMVFFTLKTKEVTIKCLDKKFKLHLKNRATIKNKIRNTKMFHLLSLSPSYPYLFMPFINQMKVKIKPIIKK